MLIQSVEHVDRFVLLQIKVNAPKRKDEDEEEASSPVICEECGRSDRRHRLLVCIQCDSGYDISEPLHLFILWFVG